MTDWKTRWREADSGLDGGPSDAEIERIRRIVIAAAGDAPRRAALGWPRAFVVTAALLVMVCASVLTGLQRATRQIEGDAPVVPVAADGAPGTTVGGSADGDRQQLHFRTPGGTRIIWVFDAQFEAKGTLP
jgi:hypothetical protein